MNALLWLGLLPIAMLSSQASASPKKSPVPPSEALASFETAPGLRVELVASEPLTASPCAIAFDQKRRMFVAENRGYPIGPAEGKPGAGVIAMLEDTDGDGRMDKRTVFADGLSFPNGVLPWKDGIIVTCAPDVLFLRDTNGSGSANEKRVLLTGFSTTGSTQLRVNGPTLGPDGWIYLAAGLSSGTLSCPEHPERAALKMTGDVRFHPETLEVENVDGRSQYGMSFDDAGRRFICMNRLPVQHVVLSSQWLRRNPRLAFSETVQDCSERTVQTLLGGGGAGVRLFPISANITTADSHAGSFSAACGIHIWKGAGLPESYRGAALSCDPTGNLIHADRLVPRGPTFSAEPLLEGRELLASRDDWFRPVFLAQGPDEALYVADMYRKVIEHPDYLPAEIRKHTDFESGKDLGRIWRIVSNTPRDKSGRPTETVHRKSTQDESWLNAKGPATPAQTALWKKEGLTLAASENPRERFLAALALGFIQGPEATNALALIADRDSEDRWIRNAVLSSASGREMELLKSFLSKLSTSAPLGSGAREFLEFLGGSLSAPDILAAALQSVPSQKADLALPVLLGFCEKNKLIRLKELQKHPAFSWLPDLLTKLPETACNQNFPTSTRLPALRFLAQMPWDDSGSALLRLATSEPEEPLRAVAIRSLANFQNPVVSQTLLPLWPSYTPNQREIVITALLSSSYHTTAILDAIESGLLPNSAVSGARRKQILKHPSSSIRDRAEKLLQVGAASRQQAFEEAKAALHLTGIAEHGRQVFRNLCASCHRLEREGSPVGPDLLDIRNQPKESILFHILVPDAEIAPAFTAYIAETKDGRSFSGIMQSETNNSISLRGPLATETNILRNDLAKIEALSGSLMPNGLESAMSKQDLADLIAFLKGEK